MRNPLTFRSVAKPGPIDSACRCEDRVIVGRTTSSRKPKRMNRDVSPPASVAGNNSLITTLDTL